MKCMVGSGFCFSTSSYGHPVLYSLVCSQRLFAFQEANFCFGVVPFLLLFVLGCMLFFSNLRTFSLSNLCLNPAFFLRAHNDQRVLDGHLIISILEPID